MRIVEVGPRDGLQNEKAPVPTDVKLRFIARLAEAGLKEIEATSFVSPKWVPQLGDAAELWPQLPPGPLYSALVPNQKGLARAIEVGVKRIALFTAASDAFTQKNINMTVDASLEVFRQVIASFRGAGIPPADQWMRAYVSTAFECPYAGRIEPGRVAEVANRLFEMGVDEVSLGDTIGVAAPVEVFRLADALDSRRKSQIAWHFHDTHGTGIANVSAALDLGYTAFDSSAAGFGGCPYAPGAGGNLATEDLVYFLERTGMPTGVDVDRMARASEEVLAVLGRAPTAKSQLAALAAAAKCAT
ncbi:hydroxymethylglutaryl-CoA lyase [Fimbriimonas ginsengisoli]|uniref:Pyruvate carboxyltransferase n=1 Tax=Fimbriimonas ginsengisoli Gsoil 348 TaxID=661478 RepID=A0A068NS93_FIMGI|nr:hydroxymethylglutaryl-CoA lyase [Fimbriimonas ginsengisoli]AIE86217.1 pyruvate carboxyltransferase [Fimbriimonas ginsengisoli Gsoil 348]